jgi:hypothetical protein
MEILIYSLELLKLLYKYFKNKNLIIYRILKFYFEILIIKNEFMNLKIYNFILKRYH